VTVLLVMVQFKMVGLELLHRSPPPHADGTKKVPFTLPFLTVKPERTDALVSPLVKMKPRA
jgi:hypothetical protein